MNDINITEFLNTSYKEYAFYVLEQRALPSVIDGFKITPRKVTYVSAKIWKNSNEEEKVETLGGRVLADAKYHHGSASLEDAIVSMAQRFKNNLPILESLGQYGSLKSPHASAPRYLETKLDPIFWEIFKDNDLLTHKDEDGKTIEPNYFLPIIPMVLINGQSGIAIGHASNILNRKPKDVIKACVNYLEGKKIPKMGLSIDGFSGEFGSDSENHKKWYMIGRWEKINSTSIKITEVPPSMTYEKWEEFLDKLIDDKKITSYENLGKGKGVIDYTIKMTRDRVIELCENEGELIKMFGLSESKTENFTCLDERGKMIIFDSAEDIVKYFVDFRLGWYHKRKEKQISVLEFEIRKIKCRGKFIKSIIDGTLTINKKTKPQIIEQIDVLKIDKIDDSYDYLLSMPIYSLTKEKWDELLEEGKKKVAKLEEVKNSDPKEIYISELSNLLKIVK